MTLSSLKSVDIMSVVAISPSNAKKGMLTKRFIINILEYPQGRKHLIDLESVLFFLHRRARIM